MIFYTKKEDKLNAATHAFGIAMAVVMWSWMAFRAISAGSGWATLGIAFAAAGMIASYVTSTVYHAWPVDDAERREQWRQWDHVAIYWHIAGSYAPITLTALRTQAGWGWGLLAFVTTAAVVGTVVSVRGLREHSYIETTCFCVMGLSVVVAFPVLMGCVSTAAVVWLIAEGVAYIGGAAVYLVSPNRQYMHTLFHVFVLAGSFCHIMAVSAVMDDYLM